MVTKQQALKKIEADRIVDGVDVTGCGAYKDKHCKDKTSIMFCDINLCSNYPNCYYKQLKRLEKERDKYKQVLEEIEAELENDLTCESRECGCDDYSECLQCLKETILNIVTEVMGDNDE